MLGSADVQRVSPKSEHSVWGASSSDPDLRSLATRLRTVSSSAITSQDGMPTHSTAAYCLLSTQLLTGMYLCSSPQPAYLVSFDGDRAREIRPIAAGDDPHQEGLGTAASERLDFLDSNV